MDIVHRQKFIWTTPKKLRLVADMVRGMSPEQALEILPLVRKRAAKPLEKAIRSAIANATQKGLKSGNLVFREIQINEGTRYRRGIPISRGRWHPVLKRTSHIRIVLTERRLQEPDVKSQTNSESKTKEDKKKEV